MDIIKDKDQDINKIYEQLYTYQITNSNIWFRVLDQKKINM